MFQLSVTVPGGIGRAMWVTIGCPSGPTAPAPVDKGVTGYGLTPTASAAGKPRA